MTTPPPRAGHTSPETNWPRDGGDPSAPGPFQGQIPPPSDVPPRTGHRAPSSHRARAGAGARPVAGAPEDVSVVRSSGVMAVGTLASRATGFLRTLVLAYVLGVGLVANAYNNANTLPNAVYDLMLGGILTSVVVPLLVNAAKRDADGGEAYDQRMFTLASVALFALTVVATLAASLLVGLYAHAFTGAEHHLTVIFAYFFIPQVFFYGMSSLAGAVLNARGHFAAPMWTPVINNIVVIAVLLLFIAIGGGTSPAAISGGQGQLLGSGTVPYDGFSTYSYAWQLFQLPYAVVGISVITALLPRMSAHAAERRYADVRSDFSGGVRLSSVIVVPAALVLAVLGAPFAEALFGYGRTSATDAAYLGIVFGIFSLGLVPYMMFQLMLRVFYALHDSRTPMYIGAAVMIANIAASVASLALLPAGNVVEGLAAAFGVANIAGTVFSWRLLSKRMHGLGGREIAGSVARMHIAAIPCAIFGLATTFT